MNYRRLTYIFIFIACVVGAGIIPSPVFSDTAAADNTLSTEEITRLFHEANDLFAEANKVAFSDKQEAESLYKKSLLRFQKIVNQGNIENGKLYYNIGNIYFRIRDIGRAILNYRKAEQYIGNDINLQKNLDFARKTRKDRIEAKQETKILKTLFFWHYDLPSKIRLLLFVIAFGGMWILAVFRIFFKKPFLKWAISIAAALSVLLAVSVAAEYLTFKRSVPGVIISDQAVAKKGNSRSYEKSFKEPLHAGTEFTVIEDRGSWLHVKLPDGRNCWLPAAGIELVR